MQTLNPLRPVMIVLGLALGLAVALLWLTGGLQAIEVWAMDGQRTFQNAMAGALRRLKAGDTGALAALLGLTFGYGFFHAAGPGHGKVLIGGYGMGSGVRLWPLIGIALASSMAQSTTAVALVYAGVGLFNWTREQMVGSVEQIMAPISYGAIGLIGLWLVWRGVRGLIRQRRAAAKPRLIHAHGLTAVSPHPSIPTEICDTCGHSHGPTLDEVAKLRTLRDGLLLVAGVAIRPCTGALFLLILTWRMGIDGAGIAGAYAMGLGTASITVLVAIVAVMARGGVIGSASRFTAARAVVPLLELAAGSVVALVALQLILQTV